MREPRAIVLVLDGCGVGELPDADSYGDVGSDTVGNTARAVGGLVMPNMQHMGFGNILDLLGVSPEPAPTASWGKSLEESAGKDTTTGHWEMMGVKTLTPFPTYPDGFPPEVMDAFTAATGYGWLGNYAASGTEIIQDLGDEHVATGKVIVYTSADSVFQIAAHEGVVPIEELYRICDIARTQVLVGKHAVGRIIARPFEGPNDQGVYTRTHRRRDFALEAPEPTVPDILEAGGVKTYGVGKIGEIFAWRGVCESPHVTDNMDAFTHMVDRVASDQPGFVFANLVDFDMLWGHRNDFVGFARGLEDVDGRMPELLDAMIDGDLLIVTADHGNDPTTPSTDHAREFAPILAYMKGVDRGVDLGVRATFSDIGDTVLDFFGMAGKCGRGESFLDTVRNA